MILPDSGRRWEVPLNRIDGFGKYAVTALFTYGSKNQSIEVTKTFWVVPMWMIITVAAIFFVMVGLVVYGIHRMRRNRRRMRRLRTRTGLRSR